MLSLFSAEVGLSDSPKGTLIFKQTQLVVTLPNGKKETHFMRGASLKVGRGSDGNDIAIPQEFASVSRHHFEIRVESGVYRLVDLGSTNGV